jgi:hypothetical protein
MESINVCFSTCDGIVSRAIRWFTRSKVSHSFLTFRDETLGRVFVMEANGRGFMIVPWAKWRTHNTLVARYRLTTDMDAQLASLRKLSEFLGSQYDYVSILGFAIRRFWSRVRNPFDSGKKLVCSEAVARFLYLTGDTSLQYFSDYGSWVPEDLLKEAESRNVFVIEEGQTVGLDDQRNDRERE